MESGRPAEKKISVALSSHSTAVPFSAARSPSKPSILSRIFNPAPLEESEGPDLEAGPESESGEKRAESEEKERKTPEDLV